MWHNKTRLVWNCSKWTMKMADVMYLINFINGFDWRIEPYSGWAFFELLMVDGQRRLYPQYEVYYIYPRMMKLGTVIPKLKKVRTKIWITSGTSCFIFSPHNWLLNNVVKLLFLSIALPTKFNHVARFIFSIWSCDQNLVALWFLWEKFITSILQWFDQKTFFWMVVLVQVQYFRTGSKYGFQNFTEVWRK